MKKTRPTFRQPRIIKCVLSLVIAVGIVGPSFAAQFDAPFYALQERMKGEWEKQDREIDRKLAALEKHFGKKPNIIYILADDVGWGEMGWQGGGKHRGTPTPTLDSMSKEGMRFFHAYAEPSCTPSRIAIMTGRHPVRTGLLSVLWPGQVDGLSPDEVTVAEILSEAGYHTAMWGKWHLGELEKYAPHNQGFDYAYYGLYNGAPDFWNASYELYNKPSGFKANAYDYPGNEVYKKLTGIDLDAPGAYMGRKGQKAEPIPDKAGTLGTFRQDAFENESIDQILDFIKEKNKTDKPFFIYWATYTQQMTGSEAFKDAPHVDRVNAQASMMAQHNDHLRRLRQTLQDEGIAENTLIVWISDNGPMYAWYPTAGYSWLKGEKGDVYEGGVRVPAVAVWPGMIDRDQDPVDFMHIVDLVPTAARLAGATDMIPSDRVTDGIDQTALLVLGEGYSRREHMFHYSADHLAAMRYHDFKIHFKPAHGGLPGMDFYNVKRDPKEMYGAFFPGLHTVTPIQNFLRMHLEQMKKYPNRVSTVTPKGAEVTPHD